MLYGSFLVEAGSVGDLVAVEESANVLSFASSVFVMLFDIVSGLRSAFTEN
jgi:hypothetical protein